MGRHEEEEDLGVPTNEECAQAGLHPRDRDVCARYLMKLNECRHENHYLPWRCKHERHAYEKCEYREFKRRRARAQNGEA